LVENHLSAIREIPELRLPQRKRIGLGERVAIFESEHRLFREHRVDHLELRLGFAKIIEGHVAIFGLLVDQH